MSKIKMPGYARAGIGLLLIGALMVAIGNYMDRGAISLYGLIIAAAGFSIYIASSIIARRKHREKHRK